jgi:hypothetical protein
LFGAILDQPAPRERQASFSADAGRADFQGPWRNTAAGCVLLAPSGDQLLHAEEAGIDGDLVELKGDLLSAIRRFGEV